MDEDEVGTYVAGVNRALEMLAGLIGSGHAAKAAELAQHALRLMHESAESVNYECELEECAGFAQELYRQACLAADVDHRALAEWLFGAAANDDYGLFHSAVADYAQVLGEPAMERLREYTRICEELISAGRDQQAAGVGAPKAEGTRQRARSRSV